MRHRNSRRRPYRPFGYYFVTTNVDRGNLYLDSNIFGYLLEHVIHLSALVNFTRPIAYKINPDHIHLLVQIGRTRTISDFMASMKRNFSRQANLIITRNQRSIFDYRENISPGEDLNLRLVGIDKFKWQKSYHSHLITSKRDFDNHLRYIKNQYLKHDLGENKFYYVDKYHVFKYR